MPSRLVEEERGVFAWSDTGGDLFEMQVHRPGVAGGQDERRALAVFGADGAEDVGRSCALIVRRRGPCAASGPAPCDLVLLADARLVGEPDLYCARIDFLFARDLVQTGGEVFLKFSIAPAACA